MSVKVTAIRRRTANVFPLFFVIFLAWRIYVTGIEISAIFDVKTCAAALASLAVLAFALHIQALNWSSILFKLSKRNIEKDDARRIYFASNIGKYLPGNVMHFVGRNLIGSKYGIGHKAVAAATAIEIFLVLSSVLLILAVFGEGYLPDSVETVFKGSALSIAATFFILSTAGIAMFSKVMKSYGVELEILKSLSWNMFLSFAALLLGSVSFANIFCTIAGIFERDAWYTATLVFLISWTAGFVTPGSPAGIGVREVMLIEFLGEYAPASLIASSVLMHRAASVAADLALFLFYRYKKGGGCVYEAHNTNTLLQRGKDSSGYDRRSSGKD